MKGYKTVYLTQMQDKLTETEEADTVSIVQTERDWYISTKKNNRVVPIIDYRVTKLINSVDFEIGQRLSKDRVADLCDAIGKWKVEIKGGEVE